MQLPFELQSLVVNKAAIDPDLFINKVMVIGEVIVFQVLNHLKRYHPVNVSLLIYLLVPEFPVVVRYQPVC